MNQQLVISRNIVNYFYQNLPAYSKNEALEIINYIEQNLIVSDKGKFHFNKLINEIEKLEPSQKKEEISRIITHWITEKSCFIEFEYKNNIKSEIDLTLKTLDKIYFQPLISLEGIKEIKKKHKQIEVHDEKSFINPQITQKLKHLPTIILLKQNVRYDLLKIFDPFLRDSSQILIEDPYLPNPSASKNVLKIIKKYPEKYFNLIFLNKKLYSNYLAEKETIYNNFVSELENLNNKGYNIQFAKKYNIKTHKERFLYTEIIQIYLPGGFDFLSDKGYLKINPENDIVEKKELRIENRRF